MYHIKETIIVEGVYDKIKLSRFLDAVIIPVHGFQLFSNPETMQTISKMARETGVVILTDSDSAGFKIRNYIKQSLPQETVKHAYIPDVHGKEKRKREPGREGLIGVEGIKDEVLLDALKKAGCEIDGTMQTARTGREITKADLMKLGLSGGGESSEKRRSLAHSLGIPMKISANMLLDMLNRLISYEELCEIVQNMCDEI